MHFRDVPASEILGKAYRAENLAALLEKTFGDSKAFTHFEPVEGWPWSARILYAGRQPGAAKLPHPHVAREMAEELRRLSLDEQTRYNPPRRIDAIKGWGIRVTRVHGEPAAIVLAEWV